MDAAVVSQEILALLQSLHRDAGKTLILVTHDEALARRCVQRRLTLLDGRIVDEVRA